MSCCVRLIANFYNSFMMWIVLMNIQEKILKKTFEIGLVHCVHTTEPLAFTVDKPFSLLQFDLSKMSPIDFPSCFFDSLFPGSNLYSDKTLDEITLNLKKLYSLGKGQRHILIFHNLDKWRSTTVGVKMIAGLRTVLDLNKESLFSVITYGTSENLIAEYNDITLPLYRFGAIFYE